MKVLEIDYDMFIYPEGISTPAEFAEYLEKNRGKFVEMKYYSTHNCVAPYYIDEEVSVKYINASMVSSFGESDITVMPREEYDEKLNAMISQKCVNCANYCVNCANYIDDGNDENIHGRLCLDGTCWGFEQKSDCDE